MIELECPNCHGAVTLSNEQENIIFSGDWFCCPRCLAAVKVVLSAVYDVSNGDEIEVEK